MLWEVFGCRIGVPGVASVGKSWSTKYGGASAPLLFREQFLGQTDTRQASLVSTENGKGRGSTYWRDEASTHLPLGAFHQGKECPFSDTESLGQ